MAVLTFLLDTGKKKELKKKKKYLFSKKSTILILFFCIRSYPADWRTYLGPAITGADNRVPVEVELAPPPPMIIHQTTDLDRIPS